MTNTKYNNLIDNKCVGLYGENLACNHLLLKGHKILKRNYIGYRSEIDLISKKNNSIYFTEVKTRRTVNSGYPQDAINKDKIQQLKKGVNSWVKEQKNKIEENIILNTISILLNNDNKFSIKELQLEA